jgi:hypothetical protein
MRKNQRANKRRRNNEGSICQRGDGRWVAQLTTDGGKRKCIYGATAEEVVNKLADARQQVRHHIPFSPERLTVESWLKTWLENTRPPNRAPKTWITYEGFVRLHFIPLLGHIRLVKLEQQDVRSFMSNRLDAGSGVTSVIQMHRALRAALQQAVKDNKLARNVAALVEPLEKPVREVDVYTPEEARRLIEAARGHRV